MRYLVILTSILFLSSCGVYQAISEEEQTQGYSAFIMLNPVTAVTGYWPPSYEPNTLAHDAEIIKGRNTCARSSDEENEILAAMDRCFAMPVVKRMSRTEVVSNFGPPDEVREDKGELVYVYKIKWAEKQPSRWLVSEAYAAAKPVRFGPN